MGPLEMSKKSHGTKFFGSLNYSKYEKVFLFYANFHTSPQKNNHFKFRQIKNVTECPIRRVEKYPKGEYEIDHFVLNDEVVMVP